MHSRNYATQKEDEDIKWQWAVRKSPCVTCHKNKKKGLISKIFKKKSDEDELTNRHKFVEYKPKFWELEYYNYLMPGCKIKPLQKKSKANKEDGKHQGGYSVCGPQNFACKNKQILISLEKNDELKHCTEKLNITLKEPFCLNEVCGKIKLSDKEDDKGEKAEFVCLNHLLDCANKSKMGDDSKDKGKNDRDC